MKVYFVDGNIMFMDNMPGVAADKIDAVNGYSKSLDVVEGIRKFYPDDNFNIVTNCPWFLSNDYTWNAELKRPEIYLWVEKEKTWKNITELTERDIKFAHNIEKMWRAGEFTD